MFLFFFVVVISLFYKSFAIFHLIIRESLSAVDETDFKYKIIDLRKKYYYKNCNVILFVYLIL